MGLKFRMGVGIKSSDAKMANLGITCINVRPQTILIPWESARRAAKVGVT
jgi:hypothetical protein